jgi:hypothetical protein
MSLTVGQSDTLTATIIPNNASERTVYWYSYDTSIATVSSSGVVTGVSYRPDSWSNRSSATTRIGVSTKCGAHRAYCNVTVTLNLPVVLTLSATNILGRSATLGGDIISSGDPVYTERGVVISTSQNPTIEGWSSTRHIISGSGIGAFTTIVSNLQPSTTYFVRAYAMHSNDTVYGNQISFSTTAPQPSTFTENFESGTNQTLAGWTFVNSSVNTNRWMVNTELARSGTRALYISDGSLSNTYTVNSWWLSVVHFYGDFDFVSTTQNPSKISFYWRGKGRTTTYGDWLEVRLVPANSFVRRDEILSSGILVYSSQGFNVDEWQLVEFTVSPMLENRRLVFSWITSAGGTPVQPPAAIDDLTITNVLL